MLLSLPLLKEDIALRFCRRDLGMLVQLLTGYNFFNWYLTLRSFHYSFYLCKVGVYCPGDVHWARLEASALGSLIAACPAWKRREEEKRGI